MNYIRKRYIHEWNGINIRTYKMFLIHKYIAQNLLNNVKHNKWRNKDHDRQVNKFVGFAEYT